MDFKKILVAVDASENSARAVEYVGRIVGSTTGFSVLLLALAKPPDRDLFATQEEWQTQCEKMEQAFAGFLEESQSRLLESGLPPDAVDTRFMCALMPSIARCILHIQQEEGFGTVVVGRRGVTKAEEFLFGSVSSKVVHYAKGCTVWVVE